MSGIIPDAGICDSCGCTLDEEDGYVVIEGNKRHRYCDECPPENEENDEEA